MLAALSLHNAELSVLLCDGSVMRALNRRHRGGDYATDVLSFALLDANSLSTASPRLLGDVVISIPTAARQARAAGKETMAELTMLLAHGLLHLLGFDHRDRREERCMLARTDMLVSAALAERSGGGGYKRSAPTAKPPRGSRTARKPADKAD
jgi:probable rRNA maturation factor